MSAIQILLHFTLGFITSFIGSIPLGSINAGVVRISITKNYKAALYFIAGATIAELFYSFIAIHFSSLLLSIPKFEFYIRLLSIPVFVLLGITYFFAKTQKETSSLTHNNSNTFLNGLTIGFLNPLQIPFWLAYGTYFISMGWIKENFVLLTIFIFGIIAGSSFLLFLIAKFSSYYASRLTINYKMINIFTGSIFIVLALYQVVLLF